MFERTFALSAAAIDAADPAAVVDLIRDKIQGELKGRTPFKFLFFADADPALKKIIFYDVTMPEHVMEFASIYGRLPGYSVTCDLETVKIHHFSEDRAKARVLKLVKESTKAKLPAIVVSDVTSSQEEDDKETSSLRAVVSATSGFLKSANEIDGRVVCSVVEDKLTKEVLPFLTIRVDERAGINRAILRSCERIYFAWSEETSYMTLICRFKMLPPFALAFPVTGVALEKCMTLYIRHEKAVGMIMYTGDETDSFEVQKGVPKFDA